MDYDVFISHASEDKPDVVRPLAEKLSQRGIKVWVDENELTLGDSLRRNIDRALINSRFGVVILSHAFFSKEWPRKELDSLVAREDGRQKVILPVWHGVSIDDVRKHSLLVADKVAATTSRGIEALADQIAKALEVEQLRNKAAGPAFAFLKETSNGETHRPLDTGFLASDGLLVKALDRLQMIADSGYGVTGCIDPAVSAQVRLLKHKPQQGFAWPAPGEDAGCYKSRSNRL